MSPISLFPSNIQNWPLQPFSQDYNLVFNTTYFVCDKFIHELRYLQLKVDSERQILGNFSWQFYFTLTGFFQKSAERKSLHISFCWRFLISVLNRGHTSNKPTRLRQLWSLTSAMRKYDLPTKVDTPLYGYVNIRT